MFRMAHYNFCDHLPHTPNPWILTVSSLQMEWICVPNMTAVNVRKRMASRQRKISSSTDTPGEKSLHSGGTKGGQSIMHFDKVSFHRLIFLLLWLKEQNRQLGKRPNLTWLNEPVCTFPHFLFTDVNDDIQLQVLLI